MTEFLEQPHPSIIFSDADQHDLPIEHFHLVILVEPDPETYMELPADSSKLKFVLNQIDEAIDAEIDPDREGDYEPGIQLADSTTFVWLNYFGSEYFSEVADTVCVTATFTMFDYDDLENFRYFLRGIAADHSDWRIAITGAMFEDDVIRVANLVQELGFETTVLTRYCLSNKTFVNLDNLFAYQDWLLQHGGFEADNWLGLGDEDEDLDFAVDDDPEGENGDD